MPLSAAVAALASRAKFGALLLLEGDGGAQRDERVRRRRAADISLRTSRLAMAMIALLVTPTAAAGKQLKVIGAGMGRTGTDSLRTALNELGYKTYHMCELLGI